MPIIDIEVVCAAGNPAAAVSATALASALGRTLGTGPGRTWVRLRVLDASAYAENDSPVSESELPVFVTVLHAHPPTGPSQELEVQALTRTVAEALARPAERVHVQYAPAAAGRQAFGGRLVR